MDPGTRVTGWGLIEVENRTVRAIDSGCLRPARGLPRPRALASLAGQLEALIERVAPASVVIETPFLGKYARAAIGLAETRGALLATLGRWGGEVFEYEPAVVKSTVVGYGTAEKRQVAYVVGRMLDVGGEIGHDAADALALALCHVRHARLDL
ncbi:MAG: crossover junction endodeoxyribonuclease RuvC [Acidobacteriota bacterium]